MSNLSAIQQHFEQLVMPRVVRHSHVYLHGYRRDDVRL